jgi:hypothetical protein
MLVLLALVLGSVALVESQALPQGQQQNQQAENQQSKVQASLVKQDVKTTDQGQTVLSTLDPPFQCFPDRNEDCYFNKYSSPIWPDVRRNMSVLTERWRNVAAQSPPYPEGLYSGRGIAVSCGPRGINNLPVLLSVLRDMGCNLPVEIWYLSSENLPFEHASWLYNHGDVMLKDLLKFAPNIEMVETNVGLRMFAIKPLVLLHSSFEEVLLLDDDNLPLRDPSYLFDHPKYKQTGAIFWPDYWRTSNLNPIWEIVQEKPHGYEQESGQLLVNKRKSWVALQVVRLEIPILIHPFD